MLSKYGMAYYKPILVPLDKNLKLSTNTGEVLENLTMYKKIVDNLIYLFIMKTYLNYIVGLKS